VLFSTPRVKARDGVTACEVEDLFHGLPAADGVGACGDGLELAHQGFPL